MSTGRTPDLTGGLKKAKEATALDETLKHLREQNGDNTYHNYYLSFSVKTTHGSANQRDLTTIYIDAGSFQFGKSVLQERDVRRSPEPLQFND